MTPDFFTIDYLAKGSPVQQAGYQSLVESNVLSLLKKYDPVLTGTLPLDIFIAGSDLDILCYAPELSAFEKDVHHFSDFAGFTVFRKAIREIPSVISRFMCCGFEVELFGQPVPTRNQYDYRHLLIEHAILQREGEAFRQKIIDLKKSGMKTEPAFAHALNLPGDPYEVMLKYPISSDAGKQSN